MFRLLFLIILLVAGVLSTPYLAGNQGYVRIETTTQVIEMSLVTLIIIWVLSLALLYFAESILCKLSAFFKAIFNFFFRRKQKVAQKKVLQGFAELSEGNYKKAMKLIGKYAKYTEEPALNFANAAIAAQKAGKVKKARYFLKEATKIADVGYIPLEIARAEIFVMQDNIKQARKVVDKMVELEPRNSEVLKIAINVYKKAQAYFALDKHLEEIKYQRLLSKEDFISLRNWVTDGLIEKELLSDGVEGLLEWWSNQRDRTSDLYAQTLMIKTLISEQSFEKASEIAYQTLRKNKDEDIGEILDSIVNIELVDDDNLMKLLAKRFDKTQNDTKVKFARILAFICARENLYEKAVEYFQIIAEQNALTTEDLAMYHHIAKELNDFETVRKLENMHREMNNIKDLHQMRIGYEKLLP